MDMQDLSGSKLDRAWSAAGCHAEVPAVLGSLCRARYRLWHLAGGGEFRLVVCRDQLCGCADVSGGTHGARISVAERAAAEYLAALNRYAIQTARRRLATT